MSAMLLAPTQDDAASRQVGLRLSPLPSSPPASAAAIPRPGPWRPRALGAPAGADILLVDDDPTVIQIMGRALAGLGRLRFATCGAEGVRMALEQQPDVLVLDAEMPDLDGFEVWRRLRDDPRFENVQLIFVTGHCSEDMEEAGLALGAADFIAKPVRPAILLARVRTHLRLKSALDSLRRLASTDSLTDCANRRVLKDALVLEWSRAARAQQPLALMMVDIDHFKRFNDRYGHVEGDRALVEVARVLQHSANRPSDLVARFGGEEFVMLLPDTPAEGARVIADGLRRRLADLGLRHEDSPLGWLSVSVGMASFEPPPGADAAQPTLVRVDAEAVGSLIGVADRALYQAKQAGRNRAEMLAITRASAPLAFGQGLDEAPPAAAVPSGEGA